jgi:hypothetical protein
LQAVLGLESLDGAGQEDELPDALVLVSTPVSFLPFVQSLAIAIKSGELTWGAKNC